MGTFSYALTAELTDRLSASAPSRTKAITVAELRGRGLTVIAATLEGVVSHEVCGVVQPGNERGWMQTLDTDIVDLVKRRYLDRQQTLRRGPAAGGPDGPS